MYADKYVSKLSDIPDTEHFAIIEVGSVTIPGDERSKTNPGHGYPEHTVASISYEVYYTRENWRQAIQDRMTSKYKNKNFKAIVVKPAIIVEKFAIEIQDEYRFNPNE
jgi:hypothetical protein